MCLAVPGKIIKIGSDKKHAIVDFGGARRRVNIMLVPGVKEGDYVIVHAGFAIEKMTKNDAKAILEELIKISKILNSESGDKN